MSDTTDITGALPNTGGFIAAWLAPGDVMYSGGEVPAGRFGMRIHGTDAELLGTPAELGEVADRISARWASPRVAAVSEVADRLARHVEQRGGFSTLAQVLGCGDVDAFARMLGLFGYHTEATNLIAAHVLNSGNGGCEYDQHADLRLLADAADTLAMMASDSIVKPIEANYEDFDQAAEDYGQQLIGATGTDAPGRKAWFLALAAETHRQDADADRLRDENGTPNNESEVREQAGDTAREALAVAEMLLT